MSQQLRRSSSNRSDQQGGGNQRSKRTKTSRKGSAGFTCPGCEYHFPNIKTREQLIRLHMEREETCRPFIIHCPGRLCEQKFISSRGLEQHFKYSPGCKLANSQMSKVHSFSSTVASIPDLSQLASTTFAVADTESCNTSSRRGSCPKTSTKKRKSMPQEAASKGICSHSPDVSSFARDFEEETTISHNNQSLIYDLTDSFAKRTPITVSKKTGFGKKASSSKGTANRSRVSHPIQDPSSARANVSSVCRATKREWDLALQGYNSESDSDYSIVSSSSESEVEEGPDESNRVATIEELLDDSSDGSTEDDSDNDSSVAPTDQLILIQQTEEAERGLTFDDVDFRRGIDLLHLLMSKKISLHRYTDFMKWRYGNSNNFISFKKIIKLAANRMYGPTLAQKMEPKISMVRLPSERAAPLVVFNVDAMIYDLLSDADLTKVENMIFQRAGNNPFHISDSDDFDDFDSSTYYSETMKAASINTREEVLCPIVLYIDEIKLDSFGKLGLEPVVMSLMIYNRKTRNLSKAWRVIGYMPNFGSMFGSKSYSADQKADDYHFCLGKILNGIKELQQNRDGYSWTFTLANEAGNDVCTYERKLHFPLAYVIGDAKGNDLLCGRYGSHHGTKCVGRDCDAVTEDCDNPEIRCNFLQMSKLQEMDKDELAQLSFRKLERNAFSGMWFGAQPYGINGCVPAEPLHQINLGLLERLVESFFDRLSKKLTLALDHHVGFTCTYFYRQSDRSYPDIVSFTSGVSDAKHLTGKEKLSRVFCIYLVLLTHAFQEEVIGSSGRIYTEDGPSTSIITRNEYNRWVNIFEETLLLTSWIYLDRHPKVFFKGGRNSIAAKRVAQFATLYKDSAPRQSGMGLKIVKFHQLLHLWWIIKLFGSLLNVDGARGESNAIVLTKQPGLKTQMRHMLLNLQTATERFKRDMITKCYNSIHNIVAVDEEDTSSDDDDGDEEGNIVRGVPRGSRFKVTFDYENECIRTKWISPKMRSKPCTFPPNISTTVYSKLSRYNGGHVGKRIAEIQGFTELLVRYPLQSTEQERSCTHTIRACPSFRASRPWFDWAIVKWEMEDSEMDIEAQVLMMLDMSCIRFEDCPPPTGQNQLVANTPHNLIEAEKVAFVHSATGTRKDKSHCGRKSNIASWLEMEEGIYQMIDVSCIQRPCFVIVDKFNSEETGGKYVPGYATDIISLLPKPMWSNKFLDYEDRRLIHQARRNKDDFVTDPDLKPYET